MPLSTFLTIDANESPAGLEDFRRRHIHHPGKVVPLHTTLAGGMCHPDEIDDDFRSRLAATCASVRSFDYQAVCVNAFPSNYVLWLAPLPVSPFEALLTRIYEALPAAREGWPFPTLHMTIGLARDREEMYATLAEFQADYSSFLPLHLKALAVSLWTERGEEYQRHSTYDLAI